MITNWQTFSTDQTQNAALYAAALYDFFIKTETLTHRAPDYTAYSDSRGFLSIGVGFNLTDVNVQAAVFNALGLVQNDPLLSSPDLADLNIVENGYIQDLKNAINNNDANLFNTTLLVNRAGRIIVG
jgi:hypothetical protein